MQRWSTPLALGCFASALFGAAPARADGSDRAEVLFNRGVEDMEAHQYESACPAIEASYKLDPRIGVVFTLAECEAQRGHIATAVARYDEYLALFAKLSRDKQRKQRDREQQSRAQRAALTPQIPELTLVLPDGAPLGTIIKRDGAMVPAAALGVSAAIDPGVHVLTTQAPFGPVTEIRVTVEKSEKKRVTLTVRTARLESPVASPFPSTPPPSTATPVSPDGGVSGQRIASYAIGGVGIAGIALGGVMGGLALSKKSTVDANCMDTACTAEGKAAADSLKAFGLVSTIGFGVGAASLLTAVVLRLTEPQAPKGSSAASGPSRSQAARLFGGATLSAGPAGAMVFLHGGW